MHTSKRQQTVSTAMSGANANITDLKKSVGMLQAYGEYDRFISLSKKYMKDRGISIGRKHQKSLGISLGSKVHQKRPRKKSVNQNIMFNE